MRAVLVWIALVAAEVAAADSEASRINTAVEAMTRLPPSLENKPHVQAALERLLTKTRGTPQFVRLVRHFQLTNQNDGLIELALNRPDTETGVEAIRWVLASKGLPGIERAIRAANAPEAAKAVQVLGNAKDKQAVGLLEKLLLDEAADQEVRRASVRALAQTQEGAKLLLASAGQQKLPESLKFTAANELNSVRWPDIKAQARATLPLPAAQNAEPLPPVSELARRKGDIAVGAQVFRRETTGCIKCHRVGNEGTEVGPALTEIGTKLAREALFEAILDPGAGISFGYEAWTVELKSGDEAYGIKASESPDEIAIKDTSGIVSRYKKSAIQSIRQGATSIMPAGLQQTISTQELVDLVEYLASLKKPGT